MVIGLPVNFVSSLKMGAPFMGATRVAYTSHSEP